MRVGVRVRVRAKVRVRVRDEKIPLTIRTGSSLQLGLHTCLKSFWFRVRNRVRVKVVVQSRLRLKETSRAQSDI